MATNGGVKGYELRSREWCSGENPQAAKPWRLKTGDVFLKVGEMG